MANPNLKGGFRFVRRLDGGTGYPQPMKYPLATTNEPLAKGDLVSLTSAGSVDRTCTDGGGGRDQTTCIGVVEAIEYKNASGQRIEATWRDLGESITDLKSGDLRKALRKGDKLTAKVLQEAAKHTGIAVANLVNILSPQTVVLGGGVMDALEDDLMPTILETTRDYAMPGTLKDVEIRASKLGDAAGITGAAVLVRQRLKITD